MNKYLLQLKQEFGKCGSWAIWGENGGIREVIKNKNFESLLKQNIIFMGYNASYDLHKAFDWENYHFIKDKKNSSWKKEHCRKLAEVLQEDEFKMFKGAYMTDIIKSHYDSNSGVMAKKINKDKTIIEKNKQSFEKELELFTKISMPEKIIVICIGNNSFKITKDIIENNVYKIYHYSNWSDKFNKDENMTGYQKVQERIRQDLREIIKIEQADI